MLRRDGRRSDRAALEMLPRWRLGRRKTEYSVANVAWSRVPLWCTCAGPGDVATVDVPNSSACDAKRCPGGYLGWLGEISCRNSTSLSLPIYRTRRYAPRRQVIELPVSAPASTSGERSSTRFEYGRVLGWRNRSGHSPRWQIPGLLRASCSCARHRPSRLKEIDDRK